MYFGPVSEVTPRPLICAESKFFKRKPQKPETATLRNADLSNVLSVRERRRLTPSPCAAVPHQMLPALLISF